MPRWIDANTKPTDPARCAWCGNAEISGAAVVPFGSRMAGHVWLHSGCWAEWMQARQTEARAAYALWCETTTMEIV